jgi:hypothetical protein
MDLEKVLVQLRQERQALDEAIFSLERLGGPVNLLGRLPDSAAKSPTNGANGYHRPATPAPGGE